MGRLKPTQKFEFLATIKVPFLLAQSDCGRFVYYIRQEPSNFYLLVNDMYLDRQTQLLMPTNSFANKHQLFYCAFNENQMYLLVGVEEENTAELRIYNMDFSGLTAKLISFYPIEGSHHLQFQRFYSIDFKHRKLTCICMFPSNFSFICLDLDTGITQHFPENDMNLDEINLENEALFTLLFTVDWSSGKAYLFAPYSENRYENVCCYTIDLNSKLVNRKSFEYSNRSVPIQANAFKPHPHFMEKSGIMCENLNFVHNGYWSQWHDQIFYYGKFSGGYLKDLLCFDSTKMMWKDIFLPNNYIHTVGLKFDNYDELRFAIVGTYLSVTKKGHYQDLKSFQLTINKPMTLRELANHKLGCNYPKLSQISQEKQQQYPFKLNAYKPLFGNEKLNIWSEIVFKKKPKNNGFEKVCNKLINLFSW